MKTWELIQKIKIVSSDLDIMYSNKNKKEIRKELKELKKEISLVLSQLDNDNLDKIYDFPENIIRDNKFFKMERKERNKKEKIEFCFMNLRFK